MAEDSDAERTEPASPKRLEQAREEGDVPRSRELATFSVLMVSGVGLWMTGGALVDKLKSTTVSGLALTREQVYNPDLLIERVASDVGSVLLAEGKTFLLVSHDLSSIYRLSNHIIVLNQGQKIAEGSADEVRRNPEVIEAYLGS